MTDNRPDFIKPSQGSASCPKCKDAKKLYYHEDRLFRCANCGQMVNAMCQAVENSASRSKVLR